MIEKPERYSMSPSARRAAIEALKAQPTPTFAAAPKATSVFPTVTDLSHWNTIPSSLAQAKEYGTLGVIHKATEGLSSVDDKLQARYFLAKEAGLLWGVYHFVRPGSMQNQLDHFLETVEDQEAVDDTTLYAIDYEDSSVSLNDLDYLMSHLEDVTGCSPVLYSGHILKEKLNGQPDERFSKYRLWLAQYASAPELPPGWSTYWLWQYSDGDYGPDPHSIPGINDPVDCDHYLGSRDQLLREWTGEINPSPPTPPTQKGKRITITINDPSGLATATVKEEEIDN